MHAEPQPGHHLLATAAPVAIVMLLHGGISSAIIDSVDPDVRNLVSYWLVSVLGPSVLWAVLVLGRTAAWRRPSAFWLGASAGIVVFAAFLAAVVLVVTGIPPLLRGTPMALILSSWVLLGCAVAVAVLLRVIGAHADRPIDAELDEEQGAAAATAASVGLAERAAPVDAARGEARRESP